VTLAGTPPPKSSTPTATQTFTNITLGATPPPRTPPTGITQLPGTGNDGGTRNAAVSVLLVLVLIAMGGGALTLGLRRR
jgi:hypothetical protein